MVLTLKPKPQLSDDDAWRRDVRLRRDFFAAADAKDATWMERVLKEAPEAVRWESSPHRLNLHDHYGITALHIAAWLCDAPMTAVLLKAGADPNCISREGAGVIHYAALRGCTDVARLLLEAGCDPNLRHRQSNSTPLIHASLAKNAEMVELLLYHGADAHATDCDGHTALARASKYETNAATIETLELAAKDGYGDTYKLGLEKKTSVRKPLTLK